MFTFPTVPAFHKDEPALDALADIMGDGNNSAIYQEFVKTEKLYKPMFRIQLLS